MSITDELRAWKSHIQTRLAPEAVLALRAEINAIADRIDKEHAEAVADALQLRGEPDRWVELPVDADGVPIEIGDYLHCDETGKDFPCRGYCCSVGKDGERRWTVECNYDTYSGTSEYVSARRCHHVKPDSWERIMDDAEKLARGDNAAVMELVERCRRLAGEGA